MVGCESLQMISELIPDPGVDVCLVPYSDETQQGCCVCMGDVYDISHRIGEKVSSAI